VKKGFDCFTWFAWLIKQRQQVFETSYKIVAFTTLSAAWFFIQTIQSVPNIISLNGGSVPGHLFWLPVNLAVFIFSMPLVVAAWRKG